MRQLWKVLCYNDVNSKTLKKHFKMSGIESFVAEAGLCWKRAAGAVHLESLHHLAGPGGDRHALGGVALLQRRVLLAHPHQPVLTRSAPPTRQELSELSAGEVGGGAVVARHEVVEQPAAGHGQV